MSDPRPGTQRSRTCKRTPFLPASELGLAALALILAVLVWAVMWRRISRPEGPIEARLDLRTSERFRAYCDGTVRIRLDGPRGQTEEARDILISSKVVVNVDDLEPGSNNDIVTIGKDQFAFRFPPRLVASVSDAKVEVYRWREHEVAFALPGVHGVPEGFDSEVSLEPATGAVWGPAGKIGEATPTGDLSSPGRRWSIQPNAGDVMVVTTKCHIQILNMMS